MMMIKVVLIKFLKNKIFRDQKILQSILKINFLNDYPIGYDLY